MTIPPSLRQEAEVLLELGNAYARRCNEGEELTDEELREWYSISERLMEINCWLSADARLRLMCDGR